MSKTKVTTALTREQYNLMLKTDTATIADLRVANLPADAIEAHELITRHALYDLREYCVFTGIERREWAELYYFTCDVAADVINADAYAGKSIDSFSIVDKAIAKVKLWHQVNEAQYFR